MWWSRLVMQSLRSCLRCSASAGLTDIYCDLCWQELVALAKNPVGRQWQGLFTVEKIWNWNSHTESAVAPLVHALKGGGLPQAYERLAILLSQRVLWHQPNLKRAELVFVPCPPSKPGSQDHAYCLALALSRIWAGSISANLKRDQQGSQKRRSRRERQKTSLSLVGPFSPIEEPGGQVVVFVDDVLTTGSTAMAAYEALHRPTDFQVWVLAERSLLLA